MKRNWIIVAAILILVTGLVVFLYLSKSKRVDPFTIIPENSFLVLEFSKPASFIQQYKENDLGNLISNVPLGKELYSRLSFLDSLSKDIDVGTDPVYVSVQKNGGEFDYIFYFKANSSFKKEFEKIIEASEERNFNIDEREIKDITIHTLSSKNASQKISWIKYSDLIVLSFSEVLLEEVIAKIDEASEVIPWKRDNNRKSDILEGEVTIYVNYQKLPALFSAFSDNQVLKSIGRFADESVLDLKVSGNQIFLNGYTYAQGSEYLNLFKGQLPQDFQVKNYLPLNASAVFYVGFDKPGNLYQDLNLYFKNHSATVLSLRDSLTRSDTSITGQIFNLLRSEITLCSVEDSSSKNLLYLKSVDPEGLLKSLSALGENQLVESKEGAGKFASAVRTDALFGEAFFIPGLQYYLLLDDYLILSDSENLLNSLNEAVAQENVWGKSVAINSILEESIGQMNVGYIINPSYILSDLITQDQLSQLQFISLQFSHLNESSLTTFAVNYEVNKTVAPAVRKEKRTYAYNNGIIDAIYPENGKGLFIHDSVHLNYLNNEGELVWSLRMDPVKISSIYAADLDKDKSTDFLFAQGNKIYCFDKNGKSLDKFPILLHDTVVTDHFSLIDYDGNKVYRLVIADRNGHVYFYDQNGNNLEGWTPKIFDSPLVDKVRHLRMSNKDYILIAETNGSIHLLNRRGEELDKFPVQLDAEIGQGVLVKKGADPGSTYILTAGKNGELNKVAFNGKIAAKENGAYTYLLRDERGAGSLIVRRKGSVVEVENTDGKKIGRSEINPEFSSISMFKYSSNSDFLSLWSPSQYLITFNNFKIIAKGDTQNLQDIKILLNEKKKEGLLVLIQPAQLDIVNFSY